MNWCDSEGRKTMFIWYVLAGICLILELLTGSLYLLFISLGLIVGGFVAWLELSVYWSIAAFVVTSLAFVFIFRLLGIHQYTATRSATNDVNVNLDIGAVVRVEQWQLRQTSVSYRGAQWQAVLAEDVHQGNPGEYVVVDITGSTLVLRPKNAV